jgi:RNA polymerase sigma-70 factor (ECF subfamily)
VDDVRRAQAGDLEAFERLYRLYSPRIFAVCLRLCGDRADAQVLAQDTFVRAWERLSAFRGEAAFGSWLHRIAVNSFLAEARGSQRRENRHAAATSADGASFVPARDIEQAVDLERAIAALPPGARTVFVLHDIEGYRHDEISRMTGSAPGTLRAQLHRARRLLMEALSR